MCRKDRTLQALRKQASKLGVKVVKSNTRSYCDYRISDNKVGSKYKVYSLNIKIAERSNTTKYIVVLAHELGHAMGSTKYVKTTLPNTKAKYNEELNAWNKAERILRKTEFNKWSYFDRLRAECLKSYEPE
jgi:hypothetical protein